MLSAGQQWRVVQPAEQLDGPLLADANVNSLSAAATCDVVAGGGMAVVSTAVESGAVDGAVGRSSLCPEGGALHRLPPRPTVSVAAVVISSGPQWRVVQSVEQSDAALLADAIVNDASVSPTCDCVGGGSGVVLSTAVESGTVSEVVGRSSLR